MKSILKMALFTALGGWLQSRRGARHSGANAGKAAAFAAYLEEHPEVTASPVPPAEAAAIAADLAAHPVLPEHAYYLGKCGDCGSRHILGCHNCTWWHVLAADPLADCSVPAGAKP